jgi:hypothetical protein
MLVKHRHKNEERQIRLKTHDWEIASSQILNMRGPLLLQENPQCFILHWHDLIPQHLQIIIHNKLCNIHPHQRTRLHCTNETLHPTRIVESSCQLQFLKRHTWILVWVRVPDVWIVPCYCVAAFDVYGAEIFRNWKDVSLMFKVEGESGIPGKEGVGCTYLEHREGQTRTPW